MYSDLLQSVHLIVQNYTAIRNWLLNLMAIGLPSQELSLKKSEKIMSGSELARLVATYVRSTIHLNTVNVTRGFTYLNLNYYRLKIFTIWSAINRFHGDNTFSN